jgi:hypothetical protein
MRCVSEGSEHGGVKFPGVAVLTKFLLDGAGLPTLLSTVELLVKFLGCTVILEVAECLFVDKRDRAMQRPLPFLPTSRTVVPLTTRSEIMPRSLFWSLPSA